MKLRRIVSSESYVPEIDGLRSVAILAVLLFHISGEVCNRGLSPLSLRSGLLDNLLGNGDRGVALFFVISAFVLGRPFFRHYRLGERRLPVSFYFMRRLTRLEPPFLLCLLIYFVAEWLTVPAFRPGLLQHTFFSALYLHNLVYPAGTMPLPNFVSWSLEVEVQFYILAPLLSQVYRVRSRWVRRGILVAATVGGCFLSTHFMARNTILTYAGFFPAGLLMADLFDDPADLKGQHWAWDLVGLAGWALVFLLPHQDVIRCFLPLVIVPIYYSVFHSVASRALFRNPVATTVGGMCYSLYLLHPLTISVAFRLVKHVRTGNEALTFVLETTLLLLAVLAVGTAYFVLIERPCMSRDWPRRALNWLRGLFPRRVASA